MFTVIIPAHDEADWIGATLAALLEQDATAPERLRTIVVANGCSDATANVARRYTEQFERRNWELCVLETPVPGKTGALNLAEADAGQGIRVYLDADVTCGPALLGALQRALAVGAPRYASGIFTIARPDSAISRHYARLWLKLPFMADGVPGCGLFAVNEAGRARWGDFPDIIADDIFVRLTFAPRERVRVEAPFAWRLPEGFAALVRVRRRWDSGVRQILERFPALAVNEDKRPLRPGDHLRLFLAQPVSYVVYVSVALASRTARYDRASWARGR